MLASESEPGAGRTGLCLLARRKGVGQKGAGLNPLSWKGGLSPYRKGNRVLGEGYLRLQVGQMG